ncbi:MAG: Cd(II)/Pb(II)-responsive transcriptional regulator [Pseudomonadota bacterium]
MKIGQLAKATGTQVENIRFYETEGLLPKAPRTDSNYRVYDDTHVSRLAFIRHCRSLDMTLAEIKVLLRFKDSPEQTCEEVNALLDEHIGHVAARIRELKELQTELKGLREQCGVARDAGVCGILGGLDRAASNNSRAASKPHAGHVKGSHGGLAR